MQFRSQPLPWKGALAADLQCSTPSGFWVTRPLQELWRCISPTRKPLGSNATNCFLRSFLLSDGSIPPSSSGLLTLVWSWELPLHQGSSLSQEQTVLAVPTLGQGMTLGLHCGGFRSWFMRKVLRTWSWAPFTVSCVWVKVFGCCFSFYLLWKWRKQQILLRCRPPKRWPKALTRHQTLTWQAPSPVCSYLATSFPELTNTTFLASHTVVLHGAASAGGPCAGAQFRGPFIPSTFSFLPEIDGVSQKLRMSTAPPECPERHCPFLYPLPLTCLSSQPYHFPWAFYPPSFLCWFPWLEKKVVRWSLE